MTRTLTLAGRAREDLTVALEPEAASTPPVNAKVAAPPLVSQPPNDDTNPHAPGSAGAPEAAFTSAYVAPGVNARPASNPVCGARRTAMVRDRPTRRCWPRRLPTSLPHQRVPILRGLPIRPPNHWPPEPQAASSAKHATDTEQRNLRSGPYGIVIS
jgi:hypothetical protein